MTAAAQLHERNIKALNRLVRSNGNAHDRLQKALRFAVKPLSPGVLDLTRIPLREERMEFSLQAVKESHGRIHKLLLADCSLQIHQESFGRLCEFLKEYGSVDHKQDQANIGEAKANTLQSLDLSYNFLRHEQLDSLVRSIRGNGSIAKQIRLRLIHLEGPAAGQSLAHLLKQNRHLQRLDISKNGRLGGGAHVALAKQGLAQNQHLEELDLGECQLDDEAGALIIESLIGHPRLRRLKMSNNELGSKSLAALTKLLSYEPPPLSSTEDKEQQVKTASKLRLLDISRNPLLFGESPVAPTLRNTMLQQQQQFGRDFVLEQVNGNSDVRSTTQQQLQASKDFARAIQNHTSLRELNMSYCEMWGEVALPLFEALQFNRSLTTLKLIGNLQLIVGDIDAPPGSDNAALTSTQLIESASETTTQLLESIARFATLKELGIDSGNFPQSRMRQLVHALTQNTTICRVSTPSHPTISFKSPRRMNAFYSDLKQCIRKNQALQEIYDNPDAPFSVFLPLLANLGGASPGQQDSKEACSLGNRRCDDIQDFGAQELSEEESTDLPALEKYNMKATFVYQMLQTLLPLHFQAYSASR